MTLLAPAATRAYALAFEGAPTGGPRALHRAVLAVLPPPARIIEARAQTVIALLRVHPDDDVRARAAEVRDRVAAAAGDPELSVGFGGPRDRERSLQVVRLHAEHAVRLGRAFDGTGRVTAFDDLGPYCFVLGRPIEEIRAFCRTILGPLAEIERRDELRTLEEFLRAHGSVNAVARALFLHRNTVRQRLKRIGELTGADLEDVDQRLQLYLAVLGQNALGELAS